MHRVLIVILVAAALAAVLPPFFTGGACQAEFDAVGNLLERARPHLLKLPEAREFLKAQGMAYEELTPERCSSWRPRDIVVECPGGVLLVGLVPVTNRVCRYYRDTDVLFQIAYNTRSQLIHIQTDMKPYRILRTPWGYELNVAK